MGKSNAKMVLAVDNFTDIVNCDEFLWLNGRIIMGMEK